MKKIIVCLLAALCCESAIALAYDRNITPDVIFGSGNANGGWTVTQVINPGDYLFELGLRAKLRYDENGQPQNIWNSNGDGTYTFNAGQIPNKPADYAEWNFEWSINSNYLNGSDSNMDLVLNEYVYQLKIDYDPTTGTNFQSFDPINVNYADHALGVHNTGNGQGTVAADAAEYATLIGTMNVAQNSWQMAWFQDATHTFNPNVAGVYDIVLEAYHNSSLAASTAIQVEVIPEPATLAILGFGALALLRKRK